MKIFEQELDNLLTAYDHNYDDYISLRKNFIEKYAEKQQPKIPEFVAKVVEDHNLSILSNWGILYPLLSTQVKSWLMSSELVNHSYTYFFINLKINGYTVDKENK